MSLADTLQGNDRLGPVCVAEKSCLGWLARAPDNQGVKEASRELGMDTPGELAQALGVLGWEGFAHWFWVTSEGMARSFILDFSRWLARSGALGCSYLLARSGSLGFSRSVARSWFLDFFCHLAKASHHAQAPRSRMVPGSQGRALYGPLSSNDSGISLPRAA